MADLTKLSDSDLNALAAGNLRDVSDEGLSHLAGPAGQDYSPNRPARVTKKDTVANGLAGIKAAITGPVIGIAQRLGLEDSQGAADVWRKDMADINAKGGGAGQVIGGLIAAAPFAMIPGANTVAGGALTGGVVGATQPTQRGESAVLNAGVGTIAGGAIPAAINVTKGARAMVVDPFTEAGRNRMAGGVLKRMAGSDAGAVAQRLATAAGETPGFTPSVAQAARNDGVSAFERTMRGINPQAFNDLDRAQRGALVDALRSVAKTPEEKAAADTLRNEAAQSLYGKAFQSDAMRRYLAKTQLDSKSMAMGGGIHQAADSVSSQLADDLATPGLRDLATRPMFAQAVQEAKTLAANKGARLADPLQSLEGLHYTKLALDDMANPAAASALGRNANAARSDIASTLSDEMSNISPLYGNARKTFTEMSKPINQMEIGQSLYNRFVPALADQGNLPFRTNAQSYAAALRNGDELAKAATGFKGATLEGIMTPEQMKLLRGVAKDAESKAAAEAGGRGVGSDTVQKIAMSNIAAEAGIPNWLSSIARVPGGWMKRAGDVLYGNADEQVRNNLAHLLTNPSEAAKAMESAGLTPSKLAEVLKKASQAAALSAPASINALTAQ